MKKIITAVLTLALLVTGAGIHSVESQAEEMEETTSEAVENQQAEAPESNPESSAEVARETENTTETEIAPEAENVSEEENAPETESAPETEGRENSWRYTDGEWTPDSSNANARSAVSRAYHPNATRTGIDVSEHNGVIDWAAVKASGIDFAIIRCGYGMDESNQDDKFWLRNVSECERLGIPFGVYLYSYATNTDRAYSEARHVLRLIGGHNLTYPVYFDMEDESTMGCDLAGIAQAFCSTIQNAGYAVGIYACTDWWNNYLTDSRFSQWYHWVAQYHSSCTYGGEYAMWQYTSEGSVSGIGGNVDLNYLIGSPSSHGMSMGIMQPVEKGISYLTHVQDIGWMDTVSNGTTSGTSGQNKQVEALKIKLGTQEYEGSVEYSAHVEDIGWQSYVADGEVAGTTGQNKQVEAVKIRLTGQMAQSYDVYYRVHASEFGWLDWAKNDEAAGSAGYNRQVEAMEVRLVEKGGAAPGPIGNAFYEKPVQPKDLSVSYVTHVQDIGWQSAVSDGVTAGTTGQNKQIEALKVSLNNKVYSGGIEYMAHVEDIGWQSYAGEGTTAGTTGRNKQIEAVKIRLTGELAKHYDLYYRVHSSEFGWLGWTANGQAAGSEGYARQAEAIQIRVVAKGAAAPGNTGNSFYKK